MAYIDKTWVIGLEKIYVNIIYMSTPETKRKAKTASASKRKAKSASASKRKAKSGSKKFLNKKPKPKTRKNKNKEEHADNMEKIQQMWKSLFEDSNESNNNPSHIDSTVKSNMVPTNNNKKHKKTVIVLIHADWCGHCQRLMPEWQQMKETLDENERSNITFEEIESANINQRLPEISKIYMDGADIEYNGFPTIGHIQDNQFKKYNDERNKEQMLKWIRNMNR